MAHHILLSILTTSTYTFAHVSIFRRDAASDRHQTEQCGFRAPKRWQQCCAIVVSRDKTRCLKVHSCRPTAGSSAKLFSHLIGIISVIPILPCLRECILARLRNVRVGFVFVKGCGVLFSCVRAVTALWSVAVLNLL